VSEARSHQKVIGLVLPGRSEAGDDGEKQHGWTYEGAKPKDKRVVRQKRDRTPIFWNTARHPLQAADRAQRSRVSARRQAFWRALYRSGNGVGIARWITLHRIDPTSPWTRAINPRWRRQRDMTL
jgi:hypothetical protein